MGRKCCVPNCDSGTKCSICQVSFCYFKTPRDPMMLKKWELALGMKNQSLQLQDRVCSLHFRKYDIITKRFVSLKRPTTNSKMILEVSKLERHAIPTIFLHEMKQCTHNRSKYKSSIKCNAKSCRTESTGTSEQASSQSEDDSDDSSADEYKQQKSHQSPLPSRKDYRVTVENVANRSNRRQIRALTNLRAKWLEKKMNLTNEIRLLEARIAEFTRMDKETYESN